MKKGDKIIILGSHSVPTQEGRFLGRKMVGGKVGYKVFLGLTGKEDLVSPSMVIAKRQGNPPLFKHGKIKGFEIGASPEIAAKSGKETQANILSEMFGLVVRWSPKKMSLALPGIAEKRMGTRGFYVYRQKTTSKASLVGVEKEFAGENYSKALAFLTYAAEKAKKTGDDPVRVLRDDFVAKVLSKRRKKNPPVFDGDKFKGYSLSPKEAGEMIKNYQGKGPKRGAILASLAGEDIQWSHSKGEYGYVLKKGKSKVVLGPSLQTAEMILSMAYEMAGANGNVFAAVQKIFNENEKKIEKVKAKRKVAEKKVTKVKKAKAAKKPKEKQEAQIETAVAVDQATDVIETIDVSTLTPKQEEVLKAEHARLKKVERSLGSLPVYEAPKRIKKAKKILIQKPKPKPEPKKRGRKPKAEVATTEPVKLSQADKKALDSMAGSFLDAIAKKFGGV